MNVLGIADEPYDNLSETLKGALTEYYKVDNMQDYDQVFRACAFFSFKYGKIDRIESQNEFWLELDAQLRTDFNVPGFKVEDMDRIKNKSAMKEVFRSLDIPVAEGRVFQSYEDAVALAEELGYPVCIKPDSGVGASDTYKIRNKDQLNDFFAGKKDFNYIMEEFIDGDIVTFDGLTDRYGNVVFTSTLNYDKAVLDILEEFNDMYYYIPRDIPEDLRDYGMKCVEAFNIKERFFHIEFFRLKDTGELMALEVNCRPPGGFTMDMFNYANDIDMYAEYANIVAGDIFREEVTRPYYCCYISRRNWRDYYHSREEVERVFEKEIVASEDMPDIFSAVMGNYGFVFRSETMDQMMDIINYIGATKEEA